MEQKTIHPVTLDKVFFTRSVVIAVAGHKPGGSVAPSDHENKIELALVEPPVRYMATMRTSLNLEGLDTAPYVIDMECIGFFIVDPSISGDEAARATMITAHSVLYGAIREAVAWITGRQPHGQLMLGLSILQSPPPDKST